MVDTLKKECRKVSTNTAAPRDRKFKWQHGYRVNISGNRNKQYNGLDPGCVMTIISYKNSKSIVTELN